MSSMARKKPKRIAKSIGIRLKPEILEALRRYIEAAEPRPSMTAVVDLSLRRYLSEKGYWPPPD